MIQWGYAQEKAYPGLQRVYAGSDSVAAPGFRRRNRAKPPGSGGECGHRENGSAGGVRAVQRGWNFQLSPENAAEGTDLRL